MAIDLEAPDLAAKHRAGKFPLPNWEQSAQANALQGLKELRSALRSSFGAAAGTSLVAVAILLLTGNISPHLPIAWAKVLSAVGGFLAAWATLFALGGIWRSWEGIALHELVHPKLFCLLFIPGTFVAMVGQLW